MKPSSSCDLSIVETEVDVKLYEYFVENVQNPYNIIIEKLEAYKQNKTLNEDQLTGNTLNHAIDFYLQTISWDAEWINELVKFIEKDIKTTKSIIIHNINPKTHQIFRKYIKNKYKGQDFQYHYNLELNIVIKLYTMKRLLPLRIIGESSRNTRKKGGVLPNNLKLGLTCNEFKKLIKKHAQNHKIYREELETTCQKYGLSTKDTKGGINLYDLI